ncbi:unnamed protein product, partial [Timema podura]|nr:unnamed protein product [Timema podura]
FLFHIQLLSQALLDCYQSSNEAGRPLALKVFVAGRNRLENEGAKALAKVFKMVGTLEEVTIPQNGIYHVGVTALCEAFALNPNLRLLNLNDNTVREKGAIAMAEALPSLQNLIHLNLGDCLLKTKGALLLAEALTDGHSKLQEVHLGFNEITAEGGLALAKAMKNKKDLKQLELGGNMFGKIGRKHLILELKESSRLDALGSLRIMINVQDFMHSPTADNFLKLGANRNQLLIQEVKMILSQHKILHWLAAMFYFKSCLYGEHKMKRPPEVNNALLVHLGLIKTLHYCKSEDKNLKLTWNLDGCMTALNYAVQQEYFPSRMDLRINGKLLEQVTAVGMRY